MKSAIAKIEKDGTLIELLNGTTWTVSSFDVYRTSMWSVGDKIVTSFSSLTNESRNNKKVSAAQTI